jgi:molybdate-binding protein/DNA-binding XRE family transcriptional regulator
MAAIRGERGISAAALASKVGVSRQTIYAIEAGSYVPNTTIALQLARALEVSVEDLFALEAESPAERRSGVEVLAAGMSMRPGQALRLCRVGNRTMAVQASPVPAYLPAADGVLLDAGVQGKATVQSFDDEDAATKRLLVAGCDPGISVLAQHAARDAGVEIVAAGCSSSQALKWLKDGKVHIAGSHLRDEATGQPNLAAVKKVFPRGGYRMVTFAVWEAGLVVARGNPKGIRGVADLGRPEVTLVNRELGAGSRFLLDHHLDLCGLGAEQVHGYRDIARGHLPAALHVYAGKADVCVATSAAARAFGLDFLPLASEQYDLVIPRRYDSLPAVQTLLDLLNRAKLRRQLQALGGYDTSCTGQMVV